MRQFGGARLSPVCLQTNEDEEAVRLLQLSKETLGAEPGLGAGLEDGEEELIVAEYESDDDAKPRNRCAGRPAGSGGGSCPGR